MPHHHGHGRGNHRRSRLGPEHDPKALAILRARHNTVLHRASAARLPGLDGLPAGSPKMPAICCCTSTRRIWLGSSSLMRRLYLSPSGTLRGAFSFAVRPIALAVVSEPAPDTRSSAAAAPANELVARVTTTAMTNVRDPTMPSEPNWRWPRRVTRRVRRTTTRPQRNHVPRSRVYRFKPGHHPRTSPSSPPPSASHSHLLVRTKPAPIQLRLAPPISPRLAGSRHRSLALAGSTNENIAVS